MGTACWKALAQIFSFILNIIHSIYLLTRTKQKKNENSIFINYHIIAVVSHQVKKGMTQQLSLYEVEEWGLLNDDIKFQILKKSTYINFFQIKT